MTNTNKCFILNKKQNICSLNKKEINMEKDDKLKALDAALSQIEKQYGKGAVMKLGDPTAQMNVETIPTGSLSWDWVVFLREESLKSMDRNPVVRRPLLYI